MSSLVLSLLVKPFHTFTSINFLINDYHTSSQISTRFTTKTTTAAFVCIAALCVMDGVNQSFKLIFYHNIIKLLFHKAK